VRPDLGAVEDLAARLVSRVNALPPTLGTCRLLCIDGPSGAGKTTLAAAVRRAARPRRVEVLHMDAVYDGWDGLEAGMRTVAEDVLAPLGRGQSGRYRRYDWNSGRFTDEHLVEARDLLVVEGVGAGNPAYAAATTLLVWVDAPSEVRLARALDRDGQHTHDLLLGWHALEQEMFARTGIRERADVVVDGLTGRAC